MGVYFGCEERRYRIKEGIHRAPYYPVGYGKVALYVFIVGLMLTLFVVAVGVALNIAHLFENDITHTAFVIPFQFFYRVNICQILFVVRGRFAFHGFLFDFESRLIVFAHDVLQCRSLAL